MWQARQIAVWLPPFTSPCASDACGVWQVMQPFWSALCASGFCAASLTAEWQRSQSSVAFAAICCGVPELGVWQRLQVAKTSCGFDRMSPACSEPCGLWHDVQSLDAVTSPLCFSAVFGAFTSWHLAQSWPAGRISWFAWPEACASWQALQLPLAKGEWTDFAATSAFSGAWQLKQRSGVFLMSPRPLSAECGSWHLTHSPFFTGVWTAFFSRSALIVAWQPTQSCAPGLSTRCFSFDACGEWQAVQLPCFAGGCAHAAFANFSEKSAWHAAQSLRGLRLEDRRGRGRGRFRGAACGTTHSRRPRRAGARPR